MGIREILQEPFYVDLILPIQKKPIFVLRFCSISVFPGCKFNRAPRYEYERKKESKCG
ncbi:hypothetical protein BJY00DRAFT_292126 [Aspergillus carlsbadensis]|nr:hypothetical protein BJY00DRAFT_292126 [Aspergillus carlsbadensis]